LGGRGKGGEGRVAGGGFMQKEDLQEIVGGARQIKSGFQDLFERISGNRQKQKKERVGQEVTKTSKR